MVDTGRDGLVTEHVAVATLCEHDASASVSVGRQTRSDLRTETGHLIATADRSIGNCWRPPVGPQSACARAGCSDPSQCIDIVLRFVSHCVQCATTVSRDAFSSFCFVPRCALNSRSVLKFLRFRVKRI